MEKRIFAPSFESFCIMCTYSISIDDAVMDQVRPAIGDERDVALWMQQQVEMLLIQMAESSKKPLFDEDYMSGLINMSAPAWKGLQDADEWVHDMRGE